MVRGSRTLVVAANSAWNIINFRLGLIRALADAGYRPVVVAPANPAADRRLDQMGVERVAIRVDRSGVNPLADLHLLVAYRRLLRRIQPRAVLSFTVKPNIYGSLAASSLGIAAIPNVSGLGTAFIRRGPLEWLVTRLYRLAFRNFPLVLFQNPDDRQLFISRAIVSFDQSRVLPGSGIDLARFSPAPLPDGPPVFLLVSRLLRDKGIHEYVEAARILRETVPDARVQLLGPLDSGNRTKIPQRLLDRWVAQGAIEYLGTTEDVRPFIAAASCVVLPSYREGLPRSLLEGAAMGRPLIASDVPGCREVVEDGSNGYLCAPGDPVSLASAMNRMAAISPAQRAKMGERSRQKVQRRFSEALVVRAYLEALDQVGSATQQG